jgi:[ribosomal protein S5]-alanine N-acetyltransferase
MIRATGVRLIEMSLGALAAEDGSTADLGAVLGVDVPADWPPLYHDAGVRDWFSAQLAADAAAATWLGRYVVATIDGKPTLVGTAGYKGAPDVTGAVEIGYSIVEAYHRRGIGLATVRQLIDDAFADARVRSISAETPVTFSASRGLLERSGFALTGQRHDPEEGELVIYAITRS